MPFDTYRQVPRLKKLPFPEGTKIFVLVFHHSSTTRGEVVVARSMKAIDVVVRRLIEESDGTLTIGSLYEGVLRLVPAETQKKYDELTRRMKMCSDMQSTLSQMRYAQTESYMNDDDVAPPAPFQQCAFKDPETEGHTFDCPTCTARGWFSYDGVFIDGVTMEEALNVLRRVEQ